MVHGKLPWCRTLVTAALAASTVGKSAVSVARAGGLGRRRETIMGSLGRYALVSEHRLPVSSSGMLLAGALDFVVHLTKTQLPDGRVFRYVSSVREVLGFDGHQVVSSEVFATPPGDLRARPAAPLSPGRAERLATAGYDERAWMATP